MNDMTHPEKLVKPAGLDLLRAPVPEHLISPLPKGTKAQNECDPSQKINCKVCGGWHHPNIRHLDYVGHAAATHLLLDADARWSWEPLAYNEGGLPQFDANGGLWIKLTVCGVTRLGYGNADRKATSDAGAREKEVIGDALRNAAMRFGLALELWSKADIHAATDHDTDDGNGNGHAHNPERPPEQPPERDQATQAPERTGAAPPARRSAAAGKSTAASSNAPSGKSAASAEGISDGQLKNLIVKMKSLGMDDDTRAAMLRGVGVAAISPAMSLADWKKVKGALDAAARAV